MILTFRRDAGAPLGVLALPHAGASPAWFRGWALALPRAIELSTVSFDPRPSSVEAVADAALARWPLDRPFLLFGHSLGASLAYEIARRRPRGLLALVVSGRSAPWATEDAPPIAGLSDAALVAEVAHRYRALPAPVLESPGLLAATLPLLRADLAMGEAYRPAPSAPLEVPIHALAGRDDATTARGLEAWRALTARGASLELLEGDHFFVEREDARARLGEIFASYVP